VRLLVSTGVSLIEFLKQLSLVGEFHE